MKQLLYSLTLLGAMTTAVTTANGQAVQLNAHTAERTAKMNAQNERNSAHLAKLQSVAHSQVVSMARGIGPVNDNCAEATVITVGTACVATVGTSDGATESIVGPDVCGVYTYDILNDVWYSFVATGTTSIIEVTGGGTATDGYDAIILAYNGGCGALTIMDCADNTFRAGTESLSMSTVIGTTYHYRVFYYMYGDPQTVLDFTTCVRGPSAVPANNDCANAEMLTVGTECVSVAGSTDAATESMAPDSCNGFISPSALDVWYSFVANSDMTTVEVAGGPGFDVVLLVYTGDCAGLQTVGCADATFGGQVESVIISTTPGTTYYYRTFNYAPAAGQTAFDFTTCVFDTPPAPANDLCENVTPEPLANGSAVTFTGTNVGALDTEGLGMPNVWHAFTITECANVVVDYCGTSPAFGNGFGNLFIGCPDTASILNTSANDTTCGDGNLSIFYTGVPAGTYYYAVMLDPANNAEGDYTLNVTASACAAPPANDDCANAEMITVGTECIGVAGTTASATESMAPDSCNGFISPSAIDVWYSFVATGEMTTVEVAGGPGFDVVLLVYSGDCGTLELIGCADATFGGGVESVDLSTTMGTTYYYRTFNYAAATGQTAFDFTTCVYVTPAGPDNDDCAGSTMLTSAVLCNNIPGSTANATQSMAPILCNGFTSPTANDVFYSFEATGPEHTITVTGIGDFDGIIEFFMGTCGNLVSVGCTDDTFPQGAPVDEVMVQGGLTAGTTYYFRLYDYGDFSTGEYEVCVTGSAIGGIGDVTTNSLVALFPNPGAGVFTVRSFTLEGPATIEVLDVTGRLVYTENTRLVKGADHTMDLTALGMGNYNMRITANGKRTTQRLVVK